MHSSRWKHLFKMFVPTPVVRWRGSRRPGRIALTFDDGPFPGRTERVLEALHATGHRATFFVIGSRAAAHPGLLQRILDSGSEIGNHSYSHPRLSSLSRSEIRSEWERTEEAVFDAVGVRPRFLRPPFGELAPGILGHALQHRKELALWTAEFGGDEAIVDHSVTHILGSVAATHLASGEIVLLHDTNENVANAMAHLLKLLNDRGLESLNLSSLVSGQTLHADRAGNRS